MGSRRSAEWGFTNFRRQGNDQPTSSHGGLRWLAPGDDIAGKPAGSALSSSFGLRLVIRRQRLSGAGSRRQSGKNLHQDFRFDRFHEMSIEPGLDRPLSVVLLPPSGDGDERHVFSVR